jgi:hypothetical protein
VSRVIKVYSIIGFQIGLAVAEAFVIVEGLENSGADRREYLERAKIFGCAVVVGYWWETCGFGAQLDRHVK